MEERVFVADDVIKTCKSFREALLLSFRVSGRALGEVAFDCGMRPNTLSGILRLATDGHEVRHMPGDALIPFMTTCGNMVPLRWWMLRLERPFPEVSTELPLHEEVLALREKVACLEESVLTKADLLEVLQTMQAPVRRPRVQPSAARLSMRLGFVAPAWMRAEAAEMEQTMLKAA